MLQQRMGENCFVKEACSEKAFQRQMCENISVIIWFLLETICVSQEY